MRLVMSAILPPRRRLRCRAATTRSGRDGVHLHLRADLVVGAIVEPVLAQDARVADQLVERDAGEAFGQAGDRLVGGDVDAGLDAHAQRIERRRRLPARGDDVASALLQTAAQRQPDAAIRSRDQRRACHGAKLSHRRPPGRSENHDHRSRRDLVGRRDRRPDLMRPSADRAATGGCARRPASRPTSSAPASCRRLRRRRRRRAPRRVREQPPQPLARERTVALAVRLVHLGRRLRLRLRRAIVFTQSRHCFSVKVASLRSNVSVCGA